MTLAIEWYVHADDQGFASVSCTDGVTPYSANVTGYRTFRAWLAELETAINAGAADYAVDYDETTDRVVLTKQSGADYGFTWQSNSMAKLLGWAATTDTATPAATHTAPNPPGGLVQLLAWEIRGARPGKRVERQDYGHGRARNIAFGAGIEFDLAITTRSAATVLWHEGPCSTGRVRIGDLTASGAFGTADLDGYLDGTWIRIDRAETQGAIGDYSLTRCTLHASDAPIATMPAGFSRTFGLLGRGYYLSPFVRIEGIPYTFSESLLGGVLAASQPESATLVLPERTSLVWRVERDRGTTGSGQIRFGVVDPDDDLELFGGASLAQPLAADLSDTATSAQVDDVSAWPTSGSLYVGHEYVEYSGVSGGDTFTGLTRGVTGPTYAFSAAAALKWGTISDRPLHWAGRIVYLWAAVCDPYGQMVAGRNIQLWTGEVSAPPVYDSGAWWFDCESIFARLSRPAGDESVGKIAPWGPTGPGEGPMVAVPNTAVLHWALYETATPVELSGTVVCSTLLSGQGLVTDANYTWCTLHVLVSAALAHAAAQWTISTPIVPLWVSCAQADNGEWEIAIQSAQTGNFPGDGTLVIGPIILADGTSWPGWDRALRIEEESLPGSGKGLKLFSGLFRTGLSGQAAPSLVVSYEGDAWDATGVLILEGADGDEIASYAGAVSQGGKMYLPAVQRRINGTTPANGHEPGLSVGRYIELSGSAGEQIATLLESSGYGTRGDYDTLGNGYALSGTTIVAEDQLANAQGGALSTTSAVRSDASVVDHIGGLLASQGFAIAPVRSGTRLLVGIVSITPFGIATGTLTDGDIRSDAGPMLREQNPAPNVVELVPAELGGIERASTVAILAEAKLAEGERRVTYTLPSTTSSLGGVLLRVWGLQAMAARRGCVVYEVSVTPERDWLPGQILDVDVSHAALRRSDGTAGLSGLGVVLECTRDLRGACRISLLVRADALDVGPLCPAARVRTISGSDITLDTGTFDGINALFVAGETLRVYEAGVAANTADVTVSAISGVTVTLGSVPAWLTSGTIADDAVYVTYPDEGSCSARQAPFVHSEDGSQWL